MEKGDLSVGYFIGVPSVNQILLRPESAAIVCVSDLNRIRKLAKVNAFTKDYALETENNENTRLLSEQRSKLHQSNVESGRLWHNSIQERNAMKRDAIQAAKHAKEVEKERLDEEWSLIMDKERKAAQERATALQLQNSSTLQSIHGKLCTVQAIRECDKQLEYKNKKKEKLKQHENRLMEEWLNTLDAREQKIREREAAIRERTNKVVQKHREAFEAQQRRFEKERKEKLSRHGPGEMEKGLFDLKRMTPLERERYNASLSSKSWQEQQLLHLKQKEEMTNELEQSMNKALSWQNLKTRIGAAVVAKHRSDIELRQSHQLNALCVHEQAQEAVHQQRYQYQEALAAVPDPLWRRPPGGEKISSHDDPHAGRRDEYNATIRSEYEKKLEEKKRVALLREQQKRDAKQEMIQLVALEQQKQQEKRLKYRQKESELHQFHLKQQEEKKSRLTLLESKESIEKAAREKLRQEQDATIQRMVDAAMNDISRVQDVDALRMVRAKRIIDETLALQQSGDGLVEDKYPDKRVDTFHRIFPLN